jgi:hypothetical protein
MLLRISCFGIMLSLSASAVMAQAAPGDWKAAIDKRRAALIAANGPGTDASLKAGLLDMKARDQEARGIGPGAKNKDKVEIASNLAEIDAALTAQLKKIVAERGWPTIALVGYDASNAAMLILTHTPDHAWQVSLLPQLEALADANKIDPSTLATVIDKELVNEGKLQRYGTQFKYVDGAIAMYGVEDPGGLDRERAEVMLPPLDVYKQQLGAMYHLKVTNQIVMAHASH